MSRLPERAVTRLLDRFADDLTGRQRDRLRALARLIDPAGRIPLARALQVATPEGDEQARQAAFRKFRASVTEATGTQLRLVVDSRKTSPESRYCWFEGVDETSDELAERSERESRRHTGERVVPPAAAEVLDPPRITVYVSTAVTARAATAGLERAFLELLRERLAACGDRRYRVTSMHETAIGVERAAHRHRLREEADIVLSLTSPAYLGDSGGDDAWAAHHPEHRLLFALEKLPVGARSRHLPLDQVQLAARPFSHRTTQTAKAEYVDDCLGAIYAAVTQRETLDRARRRMPSAPPDDPGLREWARQQLLRRLDDAVPVWPRASETSLRAGLATELGHHNRGRHLGEPVSAVDRLVTWATRDSADAPPLCALLGDVGMGKTTTTKLFTQKLLQLRTDDQDVPLPILFDLRDLPVPVVRESPHLRRIVDCLLDASASSGRRPSADEVLDLVGRGNCVLIFDGLDEILVHLGPHQGQVFTRTLWRATEDAWLDRHDRGTGDRSDSRHGPHPATPSKLLLSCRTHYFRSVSEETAHFTGQHRDGPVARDYLALIMLPFSEEQIRDYLAGNVPDADVDTLMELIGSVHNLREIAERPLTLRMITQQLELVERATLAGRVVRPVDLYASFVEQWLTRDNGKHCLLPRHKQLLMEHLAAELWRSGRLGWSTDDVEQWLLEFLAARPDLELHYTSRTPDLWKEDLRTATFLVRREDDAYTFAHTSLREYFLAGYLARALELGPDQMRVVEQRWRMPVPSRETLAFLGQQLAGLAPRQWDRCRAALSALATATPEPAPEPGRAGDRPQVSPAAVLAFAYGLAATAGSYPHHRLAGSRLDGADLRRWHLGGGDQPTVDLRGVSLAGADLSDAVLDRVDLRDADLTGANLTRTELHHSDLRGLDVRGGTLVGTILRGCRLHGTRWAAAAAHRAQAVACEPPHEPALPGWLLAPSASPAPRSARLVSLTGHTGGVWGCGYSPDGTRIVTASDDGTARVWDAGTGEPLLSLTGHTSTVWGCGYSPDGTRIVTASDDGTARVW
ncbi:MAG TPA: pentapeptide repeat-containing protein, partial [Mycobacteriales bacterium]|nr:pentapeptide repeat-containing protein [Mycobacteriales bacterium]